MRKAGAAAPALQSGMFINGIPFAVIECKAPQISVEQAVEQNIRNQQKEYIPQLYKFCLLYTSSASGSTSAVQSARSGAVTVGVATMTCPGHTGMRSRGISAAAAVEASR